MSAEVEQILERVRALSPEERTELAVAMTKVEAELRPRPDPAFVRAIMGKYAHVRTSSEEFMARKREDVERER